MLIRPGLVLLLSAGSNDGIDTVVPPSTSVCAGIAKGFLGAGVGVAGLAGAAAATMFFLHKKRSSVNESLVGHDLARVHDSVIVTKQKKRVNMTTVNKEALPGMHQVMTVAQGACSLEARHAETI